MRTPNVPFERAFGVGFDLRYGDAYGFEHQQKQDVPSARIERFLEQHREELGYAFFSFQPKSRGLLDLEDYQQAWDRVAALPHPGCLGLHHTLLNLGSLEGEREESLLFDFTNALIDRYDFRWVNEDVGIWSIDDKNMPYPLPPILSEAGLDAAIARTHKVSSKLNAPLVIEFPGFSEGTNFVLGDMCAYDFFRTLADGADCPVTLDTGHLLSYRYLLGHRGEALYQNLEALPLDRCFEIHLSGCEIIDDRFVDVHHGVLRDEQLELLERLLPICPNLRAVTYEDPKPDNEGKVRARALPNFDRLRSITQRWKSEAFVSRPIESRARVASSSRVDGTFESQSNTLRALLFDPSARADFCESSLAFPLTQHTDREQLQKTARKIADDVGKREHRGAKQLGECFAKSLGANPQRSLFADFVASEHYQSFAESSVARRGCTIEEAFYRFLCAQNIGDPTTRKIEYLEAATRAVLVQPNAAFTFPSLLRGDFECAYATVTLGDKHFVIASVYGKWIRGPIDDAQCSVLENDVWRESLSSTEVQFREAKLQLEALGFRFHDRIS